MPATHTRTESRSRPTTTRHWHGTMPTSSYIGHISRQPDIKPPAWDEKSISSLNLCSFKLRLHRLRLQICVFRLKTIFSSISPLFLPRNATDLILVDIFYCKLKFTCYICPRCDAVSGVARRPSFTMQPAEHRCPMTHAVACHRRLGGRWGTT